jgi:hypothetical protein
MQPFVEKQTSEFNAIPDQDHLASVRVGLTFFLSTFRWSKVRHGVNQFSILTPWQRPRLTPKTKYLFWWIENTF